MFSHINNCQTETCFPHRDNNYCVHKCFPMSEMLDVKTVAGERNCAALTVNRRCKRQLKIRLACCVHVFKTVGNSERVKEISVIDIALCSCADRFQTEGANGVVLASTSLLSGVG